MTDPRLSRALDFIKAHQNPDGGWGYEPGRRSLVEPTSFCVLALLARGESAAAGRGLSFLRSCMKSSGAVGIDPKDPEGSWMSYAALLAFHAVGRGRRRAPPQGLDPELRGRLRPLHQG